MVVLYFDSCGEVVVMELEEYFGGGLLEVLYDGVGVGFS